MRGLFSSLSTSLALASGRWYYTLVAYLDCDHGRRSHQMGLVMLRSRNPKAGTAGRDDGNEETRLEQHQAGVVVEGGDDVGWVFECFAGREHCVKPAKQKGFSK